MNDKHIDPWTPDQTAKLLDAVRRDLSLREVERCVPGRSPVQVDIRLDTLRRRWERRLAK